MATIVYENSKDFPDYAFSVLEEIITDSETKEKDLIEVRKIQKSIAKLNKKHNVEIIVSLKVI
jgi:hypothetical protein